MIARLVRTGRAEPVAFYYGRTKPRRRRKFDRHARRWRYGDRGRKPGQMVQIDHTGVAIEAGFCVKEFKAVCPVSKLCCMRAYSRATAACASTFLDRLIRQAPFDIESVQVDGGSEFMAEFETACQRRGIALFVLPPRSPKYNGCVERANAAGRYEFHQFYAGELSVGALNVELAKFERSATPTGRIRRSDNARPCRRIMKTSTKAHLLPKKSHMYLNPDMIWGRGSRHSSP